MQFNTVHGTVLSFTQMIDVRHHDIKITNNILGRLLFTLSRQTKLIRVSVILGIWQYTNSLNGIKLQYFGKLIHLTAKLDGGAHAFYPYNLRL